MLDTGNTAFVLIATALVLLMTPGLGFFYGGMVRGRNVLNTLMLSFVTLAVVGVQWVLIGYSLAFAPGQGAWAPWIGSLKWLGLQGVGLAPEPSYAASIPHLAYVVFQGTFAIITPALISGAVVERMHFRAYAVFTALWATFVYAPIAHWVWGQGGWLKGLGALDFAGGTVVHVAAGFSALVAAAVVGSRSRPSPVVSQGYQVPFVLLGAALLWFGWFGFNGGSALEANGIAALAVTTTNTAAAAGALSWMLLEGWRERKVTVVGGASGAVAGLVAITPAAGFVSPLAAIAIGAVSAVACAYAVEWNRRRLKIDDSLDSFSVHGVGGIVGALLTGVFASKALNPAGADGLLAGHVGLLGIQLVAVLAVAAYAALATFVLLKALDRVMRLRVAETIEAEGLDMHHHGGRLGTAQLPPTEWATPGQERAL
ncbi:MAG: ammonium transporter [Candidatus Sericytochromatia bacterium]|nr:ammonium transporter [Candidatus Sericytochromatia bacterium]